MVGGQGVLDREPLGGPRIPGRHGEAIEFGTVLGWRRVDRYREVERAARPVERAMVLRSRWEYQCPFRKSLASFLGLSLIWPGRI